MRIAVIGAGSVGRNLAEATRALGHDVIVGVRDPDDPRHADAGERATPAAAAVGADLVALAVPAAAVADAVSGLTLASPTVVVDATNAVGAPPPDGFPTMGAYTRSLLPGDVPVVKAFNTIGAEHLVQAEVDGAPAFLPIAGDPAGVEVVLPLARAMGFDAVDLGGPEAIALVEDHARLWIHLMRNGWGRGFAFGVLGRPAGTAGGTS
ncbi:MAG: NAD(P)-binding domain-containing protein [Acidimicrobiales bacterium]|nr:NAD(P)-binding domain-containing protein [Acidimicrobiales bacterium]